MMVCLMTTRRQTALLAFISLLVRQGSSFTISSSAARTTQQSQHVSKLTCRFPTQLALAAEAAKADDESLSNEALKAQLSKYLLKRKEVNADEAAQK
jgi:hypothetical protein